jgi:hypothetical protein
MSLSFSSSLLVPFVKLRKMDRSVSSEPVNFTLNYPSGSNQSVICSEVSCKVALRYGEHIILQQILWTWQLWLQERKKASALLSQYCYGANEERERERERERAMLI